MQAGKDKVVSFDYTLTGPEGQEIDSSKGRHPLTYLHGANNIIPGLEAALEGKSAGDELSVTVPPEQAYGHRNEQMIQSVPRDRFQGVADIKPGMQFQANTPQGPRIVTIVAADAQNVTVDANHPLAGVPLKFDVKVTDVRDASAEELQHGHVHGPGAHQH
jgi:FKBP-type peptidyl-prolyl cis-trans isomerase SlyD